VCVLSLGGGLGRCGHLAGRGSCEVGGAGPFLFVFWLLGGLLGLVRACEAKLRLFRLSLTFVLCGTDGGVGLSLRLEAVLLILAAFL